MPNDPAFLWYSDNFLSGTMFFSYEQRGRYVTALCAQHLTGHLTADNLQSIVGTDPMILKKFKQDEKGLFYNARLEKEIKKRESFYQSRLANLSHKTSHMDSHMGGHFGNGNGIGNGIGLEIGNGKHPEEESKGETKTWRTDFEIYKAEALKALNELRLGAAWLADRMKFHPGLDIGLTLQKAWQDFWLTEAGWKNKKAGRSKEIDWVRTANNALSQKMNQVYKERRNTNTFGPSDVDQPSQITRNLNDLAKRNRNEPAA